MKKSRFTDRTKWKIIIVLMVGMVVVALFLQAGILMYVNSKNLDKTSQMLLDQSISIIEKNQKNEIDSDQVDEGRLCYPCAGSVVHSGVEAGSGK